MGTRLQCEGYPLGHYSMRDKNNDSISSWLHDYEDITSNEHLFNGFNLEPVNEYSGYDKEMFKRTMLEHEAIFRKQVCELHCLYRTQKYLMDELKRQESCELHLQTRTSQSQLFESSIASETSERIWQIPHQSEGGISFNLNSVVDTDDTKTSFEFLKENCMLFSRSLKKNGVDFSDCGLSDSKPKGLPLTKKNRDLQLSADVYINVDGSELIERESISRSSYNSSMICEVECESDVKLTLGSSEDPICLKESRNSNPIRQNGQAVENFAYLNKTIKSLSCKGEAGSVSSHFLYGTVNHEEFGGHQLPVSSDRSSLQRDFFIVEQGNEGPCSDTGEAVQGWSPFNYEDGRKGKRLNSLNPGLSNGKLPLLSQSSDLIAEGSLKIPSIGCSGTPSWFEEKPTLGVEPHHESSPLFDSNYLALTNSELPGPLSVIPSSQYTSCAYPVVLPRRKPRRIITYVPIAVQALPCFPASELSSHSRKLKESVRNSSTAGNTLHSEGDLKSPLKVGVELSSVQSNFNQNLCSDSNSLSHLKRRSNNSVYENPGSCACQKLSKLPNEVNFSGGLPSDNDENEKLGESSEGVSWLRNIPSFDDSGGGFSFSQSFSKAQGNVLSSLHVKGSRKQKNSCSHGNHPVTDELQQTTNNCPLETNLNSLEISIEDDVPSMNIRVVEKIDAEVLTAFYESLDSFAAENLVAMSLDVPRQLALASSDSLYWFANMVSSAADADDNDDNGVDVFESLTLKLKEVKPEEHLFPLKDLDNEKEGDNSGTGFLLLSKTRSHRGQARKRRQLKEFQKDVLPGLVTLTRHEVIEDFQAFECMMRAMGENWQCSLARRSTGRKGSTCQARGRRRPPRLKLTVAEKHLSPPMVQAMMANSKMEVDKRSIIGWGRRTARRGRRPRVILPEDRKKGQTYLIS